MAPETLSTGYVRANAYDQKVRRVLFAQVRKRVPNDEILRAAAELNQKIFEKLQEMGAKKRDVIRVMIDYEIKGDKIEWKWDTLKIELYKEAEAVGAKLSSILEEVEQKEEKLKELVDKLRNVAEEVRKLTYEVDALLDKVEELRG